MAYYVLSSDIFPPKVEFIVRVQRTCNLFAPLISTSLRFRDALSWRRETRHANSNRQCLLGAFWFKVSMHMCCMWMPFEPLISRCIWFWDALSKYSEFWLISRDRPCHFRDIRIRDLSSVMHVECTCNVRVPLFHGTSGIEMYRAGDSKFGSTMQLHELCQMMHIYVHVPRIIYVAARDIWFNG